MKAKHVLTIVLVAWSAMGLMAQGPKNKQEDRGILKYRTELGLTDEQVMKIREIQRQYGPKMRDARQAEPQDTQQVRQLMNEMKGKVRNILTPEQIAKMRSFRDSLTHGAGPECRKALRSYRDDKIKPVLMEQRKRFEQSLSEQEKQVIADVRAKHSAFREAMRESADREKMKQRMQDLKAETKKALKPIMENHRAELEKLKAERKDLEKQWKQDMDSIRAKCEMKGHKKQGKGKHGDPRKGNPEGHGPHKQSPAHFLLLDPNKG